MIKLKLFGYIYSCVAAEIAAELARLKEEEDEAQRLFEQEQALKKANPQGEESEEEREEVEDEECSEEDESAVGTINDKYYHSFVHSMFKLN